MVRMLAVEFAAGSRELQKIRKRKTDHHRTLVESWREVRNALDLQELRALQLVGQQQKSFSSEIKGSFDFYWSFIGDSESYLGP